jgi:hypothetical protein
VGGTVTPTTFDLAGFVAPIPTVEVNIAFFNAECHVVEHVVVTRQRRRAVRTIRPGHTSSVLAECAVCTDLGALRISLLGRPLPLVLVALLVLATIVALLIVAEMVACVAPAPMAAPLDW